MMLQLSESPNTFGKFLKTLEKLPQKIDLAILAGVEALEVNVSMWGVVL